MPVSGFPVGAATGRAAETGTSTVLSTGNALPPHRYPQRELTAAVTRFAGLDDEEQRLLHRVHAAAGVEYRHLALPIERYPELTDFGAANDAFIAAACDLSSEALRRGLDAAGISPGEIDVIITVSTTGLAVPALDARVAPVAGLRPDVVRVPIVGLGCAAGASGVARLNDYLAGHPGRAGVLLSVELCSLTLQRDDRSAANLVASGLFGDGAAAVVMTGRDRVGTATGNASATAGITPAVLAARSRLYPGTQRAMGWDVGSDGLRIVLSPDIPDLIRNQLLGDVTDFLGDHGLGLPDVDWWVCHPGGPRVLEAVEDTLGLRHGELDVTWRSLARIGNISSASVLHVLGDTLRHRPPESGSHGLMLALGPGFALELVLLRA